MMIYRLFTRSDTFWCISSQLETEMQKRIESLEAEVELCTRRLKESREIVHATAVRETKLSRGLHQVRPLTQNLFEAAKHTKNSLEAGADLCANESRRAERYSSPILSERLS